MTKTLGIMGGGQLGRMLTIAAKKLKIGTIVLDPTPNSPAGQVADEQVVGDFKDPKQIKKLAKKVDYLTFEIESANAQVLKELKEEGKHVQPQGETLEIIQDKLLQKQFLRTSKIPTAPFMKIDNEKDLQKAIKIFKYPIVLKARHHAYDGRGNAVIKNSKDIKSALKKLQYKMLYVEKYIPFKKELAIQMARTVDGKIAVYPVVETIQKNNICHIVKATAQVNKNVTSAAKKLAMKTMKALKGAGVFGIEMFLTKDNEVLINEIAPRVHNSGHYTIEACQTSQFEQHVRAVCNLPLGSTKMKTPSAVMINILGDRIGPANPKGIDKAKGVDGVFVHIYGKFETRPERKMGHITALGKNLGEALKKAETARRMISI